MARATGSYPVGREFKSHSRYQFGPLVKRLRHRPFTAVTRVRFSYGSPIGLLSVQPLIYIFRPVGQVVKTAASHAANTSSTLVRVTRQKLYSFCFFCVKQGKQKKTSPDGDVLLIRLQLDRRLKSDLHHCRKGCLPFFRSRYHTVEMVV